MCICLFCSFRDAGEGQLEVFLRNEDSKQDVPFKLTDNEDGTYTVDYEAPRSGTHSCTLRYEGEQVPSTPIKYKVIPNVDVSKIKVDGLEPSKYLHIPIFVIYCLFIIVHFICPYYYFLFYSLIKQICI